MADNLLMKFVFLLKWTEIWKWYQAMLQQYEIFFFNIIIQIEDIIKIFVKLFLIENGCELSKNKEISTLSFTAILFFYYHNTW